MQSSARIDELRQKFHENPRRYFAPLANEYRKAGDPEQAIAICRAHLAQQPAHMSGHVVYAQALYDAGRTDESKVVFEKALSLDPDNAIVLKQLGDISRQKGETAEARHWYTRALDADPHDRETAAYIAELTEPLTESGPEVEARTSNRPGEESQESVPSSEPETETVPPEAEPPEPETESIETPEEAPPRESEESIEEAPAESVPEPVDELQPIPDSESSSTKDIPFSSDREVEIPTTDEAPALVDAAGADPEEALFAADEDHELFPDSSSPFVTRTMADLYAKQGYNDQALEVYKKLAQDNPHDQEIADRIRSLSPSTPDAVEPAASDTIELAAAESVESATTEAVDFDAAAPDEPPAGMAADESSSQTEEVRPIDIEQPPVVNEFAEVTDDSDFGFPLLDDSALADAIEPRDKIEDEPTAATRSTDNAVHFTDTELGDGDEWDTSSWGAGFSSEEAEPLVDEESIEPVSFEEEAAPVESAEADASTAAAQPVEEATAPESQAESSVRHRADENLIAETDRTGDFAAPVPPLGVFNDAHDEIHEELYRPTDEPVAASAPLEFLYQPEPSADAAPEEVAEPAPSISPEPATAQDTAVEPQPVEEPEEAWRPEDASPAAELDSNVEAASAQTESQHVVAYSPQPPEDDELPHYTPVGPTIREFFATLGAYRPPENGTAPSFTARAAVPDIEPEPAYVENSAATETAPDQSASETQPADEFPMVSDALASLFQDSPVSDEDTKAAFALSGAMSSQPNQPAATKFKTPAAPSPVVAEPAPTAAAQESEEDIRRFREWLDGLADS